MTTIVHADFQRDLAAEMSQIVAAAGFEVSADADTEDACVRYANLQLRSIGVRPRQVSHSAELVARTLRPDIAAALASIERKFTEGGNVNPHLSTNLHDPLYNDPLLNEWGVHHLHLDLPSGRPARRPGYVRRADQLLFVFVTPTRALFLDVGIHGEWPDKRFVEILHANWPDEVAPWRCDMVVGADVIDHAWARRCGLSIATVLSDGTVYMSLGGGYVKSGLSLNVRRMVDSLRTRAHALEDACRRNSDKILPVVTELLGSTPSELRFELRVREERHLDLIVCETQADLRVNFDAPTEESP